jgi:hypothetical protein
MTAESVSKRVRGQLLAIYNNASTTRELNITTENTPLETAHRLQPVFGNAPAEITQGKVHLSLPAESVAVLSVH